ncbi:hypothetical protein Bca4012_001653 [Brassica carinata]|uniref:Uncharacterized protein n=1 Tax=Brassica carinata TaxID=52824 RepID=A0A8X7RXG2_BRACI|nr:hypothetical protein Bca52824_043523 [Brassica carinata]
MYALGEQDVEERKTDESGQGKEMSPVKPRPPPSNDATRRKSRRISWRLWVTDNLAGLRNGQGPFRRNSMFLEQWNHTYHAYYLVSIVVDREIALEQRVVRRRPRKESATKAERSGSNDAVTYLRS